MTTAARPYFDAATDEYIASPADAPPPPAAPPPPTATPAPAAGAVRLRVGASRLHDSRVEVPVFAQAAAPADYAGFRVHLRWDASVFRFIVVDTMWGEFRLDTCTEPVLDGDGAGVTFGCSGARQLAAGPFKTNGLLFIVALQPTRSGCSALHLVAPGASAGASTAGSYAASSASAAPQPGTLADAAVNQFADACDSPTLTPLQPSSTLDGSPEATPAQGGPTITVGAPSNDGGDVDVPIVTTGDGFSRYVGFSVHIRWDPSLFTFASASASGSVLPSAFCVSPILDTDGAGVTYGCASAGSSTSNTGILATIALTPRNSGCSPVHLFTYGGADDGDTSSGTFTVDGLTFAPQAVAYSDASVTTGGAAC